ncbi:MAG: DNA polymerase III subunit delta' [Deltaproteobacteria bacterium]|nr:DNA polymerase III subunit delta' [Deltaproteobacteria bacterium]
MSTDEPTSLFGRWGDIKGHERVVAALRRAIAAGRPHHAYLLLGPRGLGKTTIARAAVSALLCELGQSEPCGRCSACSKLTQSMHTGVLQVEPGGKANTITVDQIGEVQRQLAYRRLEGEWRVVLIHDAGLMNDSAQNKLLKTLEEPPDGTVIILTAVHPGQLLQTVRSRCQKLGLGVVPVDAVERWLVETKGAGPTMARVAAAGSRGIPGTALTLLDPEMGEERRERLTLLTRALAGDAGSIGEAVSLVDRDKLGCAEMLVLVQELLRDAIARSVGVEASLVHPDVSLAGPLATLPGRALADYALRIEDVQEKLTRNVHPGGLMEGLLLEISGA